MMSVRIVLFCACAWCWMDYNRCSGTSEAIMHKVINDYINVTLDWKRKAAGGNITMANLVMDWKKNLAFTAMSGQFSCVGGQLTNLSDVQKVGKAEITATEFKITAIVPLLINVAEISYQCTAKKQPMGGRKEKNVDITVNKIKLQMTLVFGLESPSCDPIVGDLKLMYVQNLNCSPGKSSHFRETLLENKYTIITLLTGTLTKLAESNYFRSDLNICKQILQLDPN